MNWRRDQINIWKSGKRETNKPIDVNHPLDSILYSHLTGQSPLHLALYPYNNDEAACLAIVDLLLKNGAQVNVKDMYGETPLHYAVRLNGKEKFNILKKILEAGADVNAYGTSQGMEGVTSFNHLLGTGHYSAELLALFVRHGCRFNAYNPLHEVGYVAVAFCGRKYESEEKKILLQAMMDHPHTIKPDEQGRTVIHSLIGNSGTALNCKGYVKLIDELKAMSRCDVDDQDKKGRTALHLAAYHGNEWALNALLIAGTNINITDNDGKVAFDYLKRYPNYMRAIIASQVKKHELVGLDVSQKNIDLAKSVEYDEASLEVTIQTELELAKSVRIVLPSLTLRHFLYEINSKVTAAVIGNHASIEEFFHNFEDKRFEKLRSIIKLQYRKAVVRSNLIEPAAVALDVISGCSVLIGEMVVSFLKNDDLKHLIEASAMM